MRHLRVLIRRGCGIFLLLILFHSATAEPIDSFPLPPLHFDPKGDLVLTASPASSNKDFDFLVGKWTMKNKHLDARLVGCKTFTEFESTVENYAGLEGMGNFDIVRRQLPNGKVDEGRTIRTFDPQTRLWRLYWMDSNGSPPPS